jgi:hypothetical protein
MDVRTAPEMQSKYRNEAVKIVIETLRPIAVMAPISPYQRRSLFVSAEHVEHLRQLLLEQTGLIEHRANGSPSRVECASHLILASQRGM